MFDYDQLDEYIEVDGALRLQADENTAAEEAESGIDVRLRASEEDVRAAEAQLCEASKGLYNPSDMGRRRREPAPDSRLRVSVVTPTTEDRSAFHEQLWTCFQKQTWPEKELVVVEAYRTRPSKVFSMLTGHRDELLHLHFQRVQDLSVGMKRNMGVALASGDIIVSFDDDDIYAPNYIEVMVGHLLGMRLAAVTLSSWYDFDVRTGTCGFVDPEALNDLDLLPWNSPVMKGTDKSMPEVAELFKERLEATLYGYGFSFVFFRKLALRHPYPDLRMGEDLPFMMSLRRVLGSDRVGLVRDEEGICLHVMHGRNTVASAAHRKVFYSEMRKLSVCRLNLVSGKHLEACRRAAPTPTPGASSVGRFRVHAETPAKAAEKAMSRARELVQRVQATRAERL